MSKFTNLLLAGAAMIATASIAHAGTQTTSASYGPALTDFTSPTLTLQSFNTSLGTLQSVKLTFAISSTYAGSVTAVTGGSNFEVAEQTNYRTSSSVADLNNITNKSTADMFYGTVTAGQVLTFGPFTDPESATKTATNLAPFLDTSGTPLTFTFSTATGQQIFGGGGNAVTAITTNGTGSITAVYTYADAAPPNNPVPEPASMAILGAGLVGLGLARRKKQ